MSFLKLYVGLLFGLIFSCPAYAYLDPGSGNALVYLLISLGSASLFFIKSMAYKLIRLVTGKSVEVKTEKQSGGDLVIFSEGSSYWKTFKPIIEELIKRKIYFKYVTFDKHDPALLLDNEYLDSSYIRKTNVGFAKLSNIRADVMLATTPNIGNSDYPLKKSPKVKQLVHIWHSCCDTGFYKIGALDSYDVALTVGPWVEEKIREVEQKRNLDRKEVVSVGLPYLDELSKDAGELQARGNNNKVSENKTVLVAPSWGEKNFLKYYGTEFIIDLASLGYRVIIRPHPQSFTAEPELIKHLKDYAREDQRITFDKNPNGLVSMAASDLLISDKSSIRFDYSFIFKKPVLTLDIPSKELSTYEAVYLSKIWEEEEAKKIGLVLTLEDKNKILDSVKEALDFESSDIALEREKAITNFNSSAVAIVNWIEKTIKKEESYGV